MISSELPDIHLFSEAIPQLDQNIIISGRSEGKYVYPRHQTPYLFIANSLAKGNYRINHRGMRLSTNEFFLLAPDQQLEIRHEKPEPFQLLFILFQDNFFQESYGYFLNGTEKCLDKPFDSASSEVWLPNIAHQLSNKITDGLAALEFTAKQAPDEVDDLLLSLLKEFLLQNSDCKKQLQRIKAIKRSTKEELYTRLSIAVRMMNDCIGENISLEQIAREAGMNKFHLLDSFKSLYGVTPHKYLNNLRLQKAKKLIEQGMPVSEVCHQVGFESVGSFSNLFKKQFGVSPSRVITQKSQFSINALAAG